MPLVPGQPLLLAAVHLHHHLHGSKIGYVAVALGAFVSWAGISGPGEAALIAAGIAASRGHLDIAGVIAAGWAGATVGGMAGWAIGRYGGRRIVLAGRWLRARRERALEHGRQFYKRYGWLAVYLAPSWAAGLNAMRASRFFVVNALCALMWAAPIGLGAYLLGPSIHDVADDIGRIGAPLLVVIAVAAAVLTRWRVRRGRAASAQRRRP